MSRRLTHHQLTAINSRLPNAMQGLAQHAMRIRARASPTRSQRAFVTNAANACRLYLGLLDRVAPRSIRGDVLQSVAARRVPPMATSVIGSISSEQADALTQIFNQACGVHTLLFPGGTIVRGIQDVYRAGAQLPAVARSPWRNITHELIGEVLRTEGGGRGGAFRNPRTK